VSVSTVDVKNFRDGKWVEPMTGRYRDNENPGDLGDPVGRVADSGVADVAAAVAAAGDAMPDWLGLGSVRRGEIVLSAAGEIQSRKAEFAEVITREQGKLLREALAEVERTVEVLTYLAGEGRRLGGATLPADDARTVAVTRRQPIGPVGLITPWNFPLAIPAWKVAPALVAGCTAVLKPSPLTALSAAMLVECFEHAGVPAGALNLVHGDHAVGQALVQNPAVRGISFTGSVPVGRAIHVAGAPRFLRTQLEMGGKNAALVLADADLGLACEAIIAGAFGQAGQRCSATSRVVVDRRVSQELTDRLVERADKLRVGYGLAPDTGIGPVVNQERMQACLDGVARAVSDGGRVLTGGERQVHDVPDGWYLRPTVLGNIAASDFVAQEEIFGPVLSVIECAGMDDGLAAVNAVRFGMAAAVFTRDLSAAFSALDRIDAGMLHVNRPGVGAYPHMPHVGTKESQYGAAECSPQVWDFYLEWRSACISY
jgi:aldehyde dehydrogenase (NAD+)